jgi:hypothetical protein
MGQEQHANKLWRSVWQPDNHLRQTMKHHKYHQHYQVKAAKLHARAEAALDLLTALAIGVGLAVLLVAWWSA